MKTVNKTNIVFEVTKEELSESYFSAQIDAFMSLFHPLSIHASQCPSFHFGEDSMTLVVKKENGVVLWRGKLYGAYSMGAVVERKAELLRLFFNKWIEISFEYVEDYAKKIQRADNE